MYKIEIMIKLWFLSGDILVGRQSIDKTEVLVNKNLPVKRQHNYFNKVGRNVLF